MTSHKQTKAGPERFGDIVQGLDEALREVEAENGERRRVGGASTFLAKQIVRLKDWAANQPEEFLPEADLFPQAEEAG